jgi:hypothetical protein
VKAQLVDEPRIDALAEHLTPTHDDHVPVAAGTPGTLDCGADSLGDERDVEPELMREADDAGA